VQLLAEGGVVMIFVFLAIGISYAKRWKKALSGPFLPSGLFVFPVYVPCLRSLSTVLQISVFKSAIAVTTMIITGICFAEHDFERKSI
jgi:hypothetical protein